MPISSILLPEKAPIKDDKGFIPQLHQVGYCNKIFFDIEGILSPTILKI